MSTLSIKPIEIPNSNNNSSELISDEIIENNENYLISQNPNSNISEFDLLAEYAINDPNSFSQLLKELKPRLHSFTQLKVNDSDLLSNSKNELVRIKKHFSQLKIQFLHYETKQFIYQIIGNCDNNKKNNENNNNENDNNNNNKNWSFNLIELINNNNKSIELLENEINQCKLALAALQSDNITLSCDVLTFIPNIIKHYDLLENLTKSFIISYNNNKSNICKQKLIIENLLNYDNFVDHNQIDENITLSIDGCKHLRFLYENNLMNIKNHISQLENDLMRIENQIIPAQKILNTTQQKFQSAENHLTTGKDSHLKHSNVEWCNEMIQLLQHISGVTIEIFNQSEFILNILISNE